MQIEGRSRQFSFTNRILRRIDPEYWRKASGSPYDYWMWSNNTLRDFIVDELKDFAEIESLYIDRSRFHKFLHDWHKDTRQYKSCLLNLIYLLSLKKRFDSWGASVSL